MTRSAVILQPPLVQLNGPYPSGAYLSAFFRALPSYGISGPESVRWVDVNNRVFRSLFSFAGLSRVFDLAERASPEALGAAGEDAGREYARFLSLRERWVGWVDGIVSILTGGDRELAHAFVRSPYAPRGRRMDAFLAGLESEPDADDARVLATLAVEDIADLVTVAVDPAFSLVRYAESIAASERSFARVEAALSGPMVREFFEPVYAALWDELEAGNLVSRVPGEQTLFCVSVPFPGALVGALAMARSLRARFGSRAVIGMGGGYVNTELRSDVSPRLAEYIDHLCFDRGYGAYAAFFSDDRGARLSVSGPIRLSCPPAYRELEDRITRELAPDYADIDFRLYPRLADTPNPMHRLWSDGAWLKAYLAHGCYWHRCSFCDVSLDYIRSYLPVGIESLYASLRRQALAHGLRGIHLVDEAAPPRALRDFAHENLRHAALDKAGLIPFWGNIRFERSFTRDLADYLAAGGLAAVSGGIEIAAPSGFESIDKGISLEHLVYSCCAFKEAGILVHGYLIYGYWDEDEAELIDSLEVTRQLFRAGLVDSAFWHKFVLTRHSRVYCEWSARAGSPAARHTATGRSAATSLDDLEPIDEPGDFADNDLRFRGEDESSRYTVPLDAALSAWMAGEGLDAPIRRWFPFPVSAPRVDPGLVDSLVSAYERARDEAWDRPHDRVADYVWLAGKPVVIGSDELCFWHLGEEVRIATGDARRIAEGLSLAGGETIDPAFLASLPPELFSALRRHGLCRVRPI